MSRGLTIGALARRAGVNVETIRYYQRRGLLPLPPKPVQGYRRYGEETLARLRFIRRAQELGFTLREIAGLLSLGDGECRQVQALAAERLEEIRRRIGDLRAMEAVLEELLARCRAGDEGGPCALVDALAERTAAGKRSP